MNVTYRDFEEKDFGALKGMVFSLYGEDPEGQTISEAKIRKTADESLARPEKLRIAMICADGAAIGYSLICFVWSNEYGGDILNIDELYIQKEYRNRRIASDFIKRQMDARGAVAIAVEATPSNSAAARFYGRLGFKASPNNHMLRLPD